MWNFITIVIVHEMLNEQICESFMDEVEETFWTLRDSKFCAEKLKYVLKIIIYSDFYFDFLTPVQMNHLYFSEQENIMYLIRERYKGYSRQTLKLCPVRDKWNKSRANKNKLKI